MRLDLRRIVLFTPDMARMTAFYRDVLGLPLRLDEPGSRVTPGAAASHCTAANRGYGARAAKLSFWPEDIANGERDACP